MELSITKKLSKGNQMSVLKNISNCSQICQDSQVCNENSENISHQIPQYQVIWAAIPV